MNDPTQTTDNVLLTPGVSIHEVSAIICTCSLCSGLPLRYHAAQLAAARKREQQRAWLSNYFARKIVEPDYLAITREVVEGIVNNG